MLHLRVVSVEDRKPTLFEIVYRETVGRFLAGIMANVGYIMIGIHKEKHGLHDMLSDTEVIYYHEKKVCVDLQMQESETTDMGIYMPATYVVEKTDAENDNNDVSISGNSDV